MNPATKEPDSTGADLLLAPEDYPNIDDLVIRDGKPVESVFVEKQQRLLTEPLYSSWTGPGEGISFKALSNVGLFYKVGNPPLVRDVMLTLDVPANVDLSQKENRSYFTWVIGKVPDVVIEIVSDRRGGEASHKMRDYARIGIPYYVVFDPEEHLTGGVLTVFELRGRNYVSIDPAWMPEAKLGLALWEGAYEGQQGRWLRWCDQQGQVIATSNERAEQAERQAARLREQLRALGVEPAE